MTDACVCACVFVGRHEYTIWEVTDAFVCVCVGSLCRESMGLKVVLEDMHTRSGASVEVLPSI
jgi:hypothetical protein